MSGRQRNILPPEKIVLPLSRQLPEVICESPGNNFGEEINSDVTEPVSFKTRFNYNSTTSSAQSQRFQDMFYKTDWPSLSDTGTDSPDCIELEGSDSSASSMFSWADAEGTKMVAEEWEKIQRTLYNESGPKVTQKHLIDECNQWKAIFPQLRVTGRSCGIANTDYDDFYDTEEEVLALHYDSDTEVKEDPKPSILMNEMFSYESKCSKLVPLRSKQKSNDISSNNTTVNKTSAKSLVDELDTFLHITPMIQNHPNNTNYNFGSRSSAIIKSEISSSRWWQRNVSPDFVSLPHQNVCGNTEQTRESSAASLFSLAGASKNLSSNINTRFNEAIRNKSCYKRQPSDKKQKHVSEKNSHLLEPLEPILANRTLPSRSISIPLGNEVKSASQKNRNVSLPPILSEDSRKKQFQDSSTTLSAKSSRKNKTTLTPINISSSNIPKQNIGDSDSLSLFNGSVSSKKLRKRSSKIKAPNFMLK